MANVLLAQETIYADDIALIMDGKSEKEVISQIEKREKEKASDENKNKIDSLLATLEPLLARSLETAAAFKEANLISDEKMEKLKINFELAKKYVAAQFKMPPIPTLDNLDKYASLLEAKDEKTAPAEEAKTKKKAGKPADNNPANSKSADSKPTDNNPANSKSADNKPADSNPANSKSADSKPTDSKPAEDTNAGTK
jgi:hypothetical protein